MAVLESQAGRKGRQAVVVDVWVSAGSTEGGDGLEEQKKDSQQAPLL